MKNYIILIALFSICFHSYGQNVGVNTLDPFGTFHIKGGSSIPFPNLRITDTIDNFARIKLESSIGEDNFWDIAASSTDNFSRFNLFYRNDSTQYNVFSLNGESGYLTRQSPLGSIFDFYYANSNEYRGYTGYDTKDYLLYVADTTSSIMFAPGGSFRNVMDKNGHLGINNLTPQAEIDVRTPATDDGAAVHLANLDQSHFLRMFSGRENLETPIIYWNHGDSLILGQTFADDSNYAPFLSLNGKTIGVHNPTRSVFIGAGAGTNNNTFGTGNIGIGSGAYHLIEDGYDNVAIGDSAFYNTTGFSRDNVIIGAQAAKNSSQLIGVTAIGSGALKENTSNVNTAIGRNAMTAHEQGFRNVAVGDQALLKDITGDDNTSVGSASMFGNIDGDRNVAIGSVALFANKGGDNNVAIGYNSLANDTSGIFNTVVGYSAAENNHSGSYNTILGAGAGSSFGAKNYEKNVYIGYNAGSFETEDNRLYIDNSSTADPLIYGEFNNNFLRINGQQEVTGDLTVGDKFIVDASIGWVGVGTSNPLSELHVKDATAWSRFTNESVLGGDAVIRLTDNAAQDIDYQWTIRRDGSDGGNLDWRHSSVSIMALTPTGSLGLGGIAGDSPNYKLDVSGTINANSGLSGVAYRIDGKEAIWSDGTRFSWGFGDNDITHNQFEKPISVGAGSGSVPGYTLRVNWSAGKPGGGTWLNTSDIRLKENVNSFEDGLSKIMKIQPVTFQYNELSGYDTEPEYVGVIAQELQKVAPYMVNENLDGYLDVDNSAMTYMLINAMKEQQISIDRLENNNTTLKENNEALIRRLEALEELVTMNTKK